MNSMKRLVRLTIQAVLDAERDAPSDAEEDRDSQPPISRPNAKNCREMKTRLGVITLQLPLVNGEPFVSELFSRYLSDELNFLLLLGRILVRGRATPEMVRRIAERLCGHPFGAEQLAEIVAVIDDEMPHYLQRELEHERGRPLAGFAH